MVSKLLSGLAATALMLAPAGALAQSAPAPAVETVSSDSALRGSSDMVIAGVFFSVLVLLIVFQDDLFGDDGDLNPAPAPVTP